MMRHAAKVVFWLLLWSPSARADFFIAPPMNIQANVEADSQPFTVQNDVYSADIQLTDSAGNTTPLAGSNWLTTTGNILQWGLQISTDGGVTWDWSIWQLLPFGSVGKNGQMPALGEAQGPPPLAYAGAEFRFSIITDTNITLGAEIAINEPLPAPTPVPAPASIVLLLTGLPFIGLAIRAGRLRFRSDGPAQHKDIEEK